MLFLIRNIKEILQENGCEKMSDRVAETCEAGDRREFCGTLVTQPNQVKR